jgi:small subunit ribosomal protein S2
MAEENQAVPSGQTILYPEEASREMIDAGVFYGRNKSKTNPKMKGYVLTNRGGVEIINLAKTSGALDRATGFLKEKVKGGGLVLLVGTQPAAEEGILRLANKFGLPYVTTRWAGGIITNFKVVSKRIEYFKKLRSDLASGVLADKYTKKERLMLEKELKRLLELFGGLENLTREPDGLIVVDPNLHATAVREANKAKIPVIALANVDANPDAIDYLIPGNDKSRKSINWFLEKMESAIGEALASRAAARLEAEKTAVEAAAKTNEVKASEN